MGTVAVAGIVERLAWPDRRGADHALGRPRQPVGPFQFAGHQLGVEELALEGSVLLVRQFAFGVYRDYHF